MKESIFILMTIFLFGCPSKSSNENSGWVYPDNRNAVFEIFSNDKKIKRELDTVQVLWNGQELLNKWDDNSSSINRTQIFDIVSYDFRGKSITRVVNNFNISKNELVYSDTSEFNIQEIKDFIVEDNKYKVAKHAMPNFDKPTYRTLYWFVCDSIGLIATKSISKSRILRAKFDSELNSQERKLILKVTEDVEFFNLE